MQQSIQAKKNPNSVIQQDSRLPQIPDDLIKLDKKLNSDGEEILPILEAIGKTLPIGYKDLTGNIHTDFELVEQNYELEEKLGDLASENEDMSLNVYAAEVIGHGLSRIGSIDITKMKRSERRLLIRSLYFADAL